MNRCVGRWWWIAAVAVAAEASGREVIQLAVDPALSPDGTRLVFSWGGDLWTASSRGGLARPLTRHPAEDGRPAYSPDGRFLAFQSQRDGGRQVYVVPSSGGIPRRVTAHSEGTVPLSWTPDGDGILCRVRRDYGGLRGERLVVVRADGAGGERLLADAYAEDGALSPDGRELLLTRGGVELHRQGYQGSRAAQLWRYDRETELFRRVGDDLDGRRWPRWRPDGEAFYFVSGRGGCFNLWRHDLDSGREQPLTFYEDDGVLTPAVSGDGSTLVFRRGAALYRFEPATGKAPAPIELWHRSDRIRPTERRRWLRRVWNQSDWGSLDWTDDGREMAFTAGGDVYVMDTVLREPRAVTSGTLPYETEAVFTAGGEHLLVLRDWGDRVEIWRAARAEPDRPWWRNEDFMLEPVVATPTTKANLGLSPDGRVLAYAEHGRELVVADAEGGGRRVLFQAADMPYYDWSPDSRWLVCSFKDSHDNWDVWLVSVSGERPPYNLSRHPAYDAGARWSPDGRMIVFAGERGREREIDLFYVYLSEEDDDRVRRDRTLRKAEEVMQGGSAPGAPAPPMPIRVRTDPPAERTAAGGPRGFGPGDAGSPGEPHAGGARGDEAREAGAYIELEGLHQRLRRLSLPGSRETAPFWRFDGRRLGFTSTLNGRRGTYRIEFPDALEPEWMTAHTGYFPRWRGPEAGLLWLSDGVPHAFTTPYPFQLHQTVDLLEYRRLGFRLIWRAIRDDFYDPGMNGVDWEAMRRKYEDVAVAAPDGDGFRRAVEMLLGELNASHTGFELDEAAWGDWTHRSDWEEETAHLGVRFDPVFPGPGWRVAQVVPDGPTDRVQSRLWVGDVILAVDGRRIGRGLDLPLHLNGPLDRTVRLLVRGTNHETRIVDVRPIRYEAARRLQREASDRRNRRLVDGRSHGRLAYLAVRGMEWEDVARFEQDLFAHAEGRDGLIIDVRHNDGGFTADYLLAMLCRPRHAVTIPRGGTESYPQDYLPSRSWDGPLVVLCNQYTASNAEIFTHAVQAVGRGPIVGAPTPGAVISQIVRPVLDLGRVRAPRRGWYRAEDGRELERNGVQPDIEIWPCPGHLSTGRDEQLESAIDVLHRIVAAERESEENQRR